MTELGIGADLLRLVGGIFWIVVIGALLAAFFLPKTRKNRIVAVSVVLGLFAAFPGRWAWNDYQVQRAYQQRLAKADTVFNERCKTAGEKIYKTVEGVEGILLMKIRSEKDNFLVDPYGNDSVGDSYIKSFLNGYHPNAGEPVPGAPPRLGYRYVESVDPTDGQRYRYTGRIDQPWLRDKNYGEWVRRFVLDKVPAPGAAPRYGVTYDDISTPEERALWIAGSSLKVIDTETNEVVAERIGYMMDRGQGNTSGGRSPWLLAADHACPTFQRNPFHPVSPGHGASAQAIQTEDFVEKTLKPKLEK